MNAFTARPNGIRGCQISSVMQRPACNNKAVVSRITEKRNISLCRKHDDKFGNLISENVFALGDQPLDTRK